MIDENIKKLQEELLWLMYENKISQLEYNESIKHIEELKTLNNTITKKDEDLR